MNRDALVPILIAALAVVALGVGAATLDQIDSGSGGVGVTDGDSIGPGTGAKVDLGQPTIPESDPPAIPPIVRRVLAVLFVAALLVGLYAWRDNLRGLARLSAIVAGIVLLLYLIYTQLSLGGQPGKGGFFGDRKITLPGGGSLGEGAKAVTTNSPPLAALVGIVLVVGIVVLFYFARSGGASESESGSDPDEQTAEVAVDVGRAAGRAADRIDEESETKNEVYRAWAEMTDHLDVANPQSSTPGEFARAATDAGMARGDVDELTDLFRTVRYGGTSITDDRESRAVTALRRIEHEYAEDR